MGPRSSAVLPLQNADVRSFCPLRALRARQQAGQVPTRVWLLPNPVVGYVPACAATGIGMDDGISQADLQKAVEAGARIRRVVVVELSDGSYAAFVRFAGRPGFRRLTLRRYEGVKRWKDLHPLRAALSRYRFHGSLWLCPYDHPLLMRLGISLAAEVT